MFESYYALTAPSDLPWYWFVPLAIVWLVGWLFMCKEYSLKRGTLELLKAAYRVFIRDRISLKAIDIFLTGVILIFLARPLMYWPIAGMVSVFIGQWITTIAAAIMVMGMVKDIVKAIKRRKAMKKALEV